LKQGFTVKGTLLILILALVTGVTVAPAATLDLDQTALQVDRENLSFGFADWPNISLGENEKFAAQRFLIALQPTELINDLRITASNQISLGSLPFVEDLPTGIEQNYDIETIRAGHPNLATPGMLMGEITEYSQRYADLLLFPISHTADGALFFNESITISIGERVISAEQLHPYAKVSQTVQMAPSVATAAPQYLIVTSQSLIDALQPLKQYRIATGYDARIVAIEEIYATTSGVDQEEQLREYLKSYYAQGGLYLLLAGDESVLPMRLTYHYTNHSDTLISPVNLQITDLYFADLTGDWDRDHDGTWGERLDDAADIVPELLVGRLPFNQASDFVAYTNKLIGYETDPGHGDRSYLTRAFFFSSDQMRDLNDGQHNQIASAYPLDFSVDTISGVEATRGDDPAPSNLAPALLKDVTETGFGIINIIAHGRSDGFVMKSANYNQWPKTIMLTESVGGHGKFSDMTAEGKPSFYYSLACDNTQFDCDQPYFGATAPNFGQALLADPNGAVGFVGHSRWGWVGTSYMMQQLFFDSLFAHPDRPAVMAMNGCKAALYFYRDMVYGLNYLGDPALRVYQSVPVSPTFSSDPNNSQVIIVTVSGRPLNNCPVAVSLDDSLIEVAVTDLAGRAVFATPLSSGLIYNVSVNKPGFTVSRGYLNGSIATDVDEDPSSLPRQFALNQNYPNPFNPSTVISFDLPQRANVSLVVFNLLGQVVARLIDREMSAGKQSVIWNADSNAAGIYFYRLTAGEFSETKKMVLLK
jgi:hypothetical protein